MHAIQKQTFLKQNLVEKPHGKQPVRRLKRRLDSIVRMGGDGIS
jgi:hypothetical protein